MNKDATEQMEIRTDIPKPRNTIYSEYIERLLDILLSGIVIIVLSPLLVVISILEPVCHGKPIFYINKKSGKDGKIFGVYKFRFMSNEYDRNGKLLRSSKHTTSFGRILRKYSLGELASLFNVFNGAMSIIGPRPLVTEYLSLYDEHHKYHHSIRPGPRCQKVGGDDKLTAVSWTWNVQFESNICYVEHVSFFLDVEMVLKVIRIMLSKSEMRTNSDRIRFNETDLNEARPRYEIIKKEAEVTEKGQ